MITPLNIKSTPDKTPRIFPQELAVSLREKFWALNFCMEPTQKDEEGVLFSAVALPTVWIVPLRCANYCESLHQNKERNALIKAKGN